MKQSNISKIAALRKCLNRFAYTKDSAIAHVKDYLGKELKFETEDVVNTRGHVAIMFTVYDENDEYRRFQAEICADKEEFHFKGIGLEENLYRCNVQLISGINNKSRINHKHAWIVPFIEANSGCWRFWKVLVSYNTVIAVWKETDNVIYLQRNARNYSNTTRRHLSDFERYVSNILGATNKTAVLKWACFEG